MRKKRTPVSTTAPWLLPGGHLVGLRFDLLEALRALDGKAPREIKASDLWDSDADPTTPEEDRQQNVALVYAIGPVTQYEGICSWMFGGCSLECFMESMEAAAADPSIDAIVMVVDSPGGEAAGVADAADRIRAISLLKPVVAMVTGDGCSAAYWLPAASSKIVASQTGILGSIGVVMTYIDDSEADKMEGIRRIEFVSSVSPDKRPDPATKEGRATIQALVDKFGQLFVSKVAALRGVTEEKVLSDFGQGGVLMGADAVAAGLADQVGTLDDAIQAALELAGAASTSSTGATPPTARASAGQGEPMPETKTAAELLAEFPEAAASIAAGAAQTERNRISAIQKYNTPAYRAFAQKEIDAAIADPAMTAEKLAVQILEAQNGKLAKVKTEREEDKVEVEEPDAPPQDQPATAAKPKVDTAAVYDRLNGRAAKEGK